MSNVLTGAYMPEPSPDGKTLAYVGYTHEGFDLFAMPLDESSTFIRSRVNGRGLSGQLPFAGVGMFWSGLGSMEAETRGCATGAAPGFLPSF